MSPADSLQFLDRYGVVILPALAVAEQIGLPLPAVPALLAVGALAAHGRSSIPLVLGAISVAALAIDFVWYELGRRRGARVLVRLCQLSLEADSWLRRAESTFARYGARSMLAAKFIPGLTTVMPPLAGVFAITRGRFALYDLAGVLLWAGTWLALGYFFSDAIVLIAAKASALGRMLGLVIATALAGYILVKYGRRRLFLKKLRTAPVSPEALKRRLDAGDDVTIIDLRTALDVAATPYAIPGSRWLADDAIDEHEVELLRSRDVVLYCASPNDATSARVALQLKHKGISRVRPLEGGLAAWMALNLPVRTVQLPVAAADESSRRAEPTAA
ncbi:MAG: sulfurtransferase [Candidatus Rokuibacteriota bacterium]|nr:MAG: sulfurtransferase [Candidatus Rokubacteria bacterium]